MLDLLAMFPGQGSQSPGMSEELLSQSSQARLLFEEAEDVCGLPLKKLCTSKEDFPKLKLTSYQQPAILTHSYATWAFLSEELGLNPSCFAGHSLGEYTALVASEKLSFHDALKLVCERAKAMEESVPAGLGGMIAVRTKDFELLSKLCFEVKETSGGVVELVNFNSPEQFILSGHSNILSHMLGVFKENKILARKLDVSGPFHSSLMKPARLEMTEKINETQFFDNEALVIANVTGKFEQPYEPKYLISQIDHPVLWTDTLQQAYTAGVNAYVEFGPGKVLSSLVSKTIPQFKFAFDTKDILSSLEKIRRELQRDEEELLATEAISKKRSSKSHPTRDR